MLESPKFKVTWQPRKAFQSPRDTYVPSEEQLNNWESPCWFFQSSWLFASIKRSWQFHISHSLPLSDQHSRAAGCGAVEPAGRHRLSWAGGVTLGLTPAAQRGEHVENVLLWYSILHGIRIHLNDVPFSLRPPWHLLIISDALSLRASCRVFSLTSSDSFYYKAGTLEGKSNLFQFSFYMEKTCNLLLMLRETPGSKGTGLKCAIKSTPWNMPMFLNRELCCDQSVYAEFV